MREDRGRPTASDDVLHRAAPRGSHAGTGQTATIEREPQPPRDQRAHAATRPRAERSEAHDRGRAARGARREIVRDAEEVTLERLTGRVLAIAAVTSDDERADDDANDIARMPLAEFRHGGMLPRRAHSGAPHVTGHVAEEARIEDSLGEVPRTVGALEAVVVLAGEDRVQALTSHLEHGEAAATGRGRLRRPERVTLVIWCRVCGVPSS